MLFKRLPVGLVLFRSLPVIGILVALGVSAVGVFHPQPGKNLWQASFSAYQDYFFSLRYPPMVCKNRVQLTKDQLRECDAYGQRRTSTLLFLMVPWIIVMSLFIFMWKKGVSIYQRAFETLNDSECFYGFGKVIEMTPPRAPVLFFILGLQSVFVETEQGKRGVLWLSHSQSVPEVGRRVVLFRWEPFQKEKGLVKNFLGMEYHPELKVFMGSSS